jgi:hypothetical protein
MGSGRAGTGDVERGGDKGGVERRGRRADSSVGEGRRWRRPQRLADACLGVVWGRLFRLSVRERNGGKKTRLIYPPPFSPGWWLQSGIKGVFSPGWIHQPGLKGL